MMFRKYSSDAEKSAWGLLRFFRGEEIFLGVIEGNVRCEEADTLARVGVDELPNASPQDGANRTVAARYCAGSKWKYGG